VLERLALVGSASEGFNVLSSGVVRALRVASSAEASLHLRDAAVGFSVLVVVALYALGRGVDDRLPTGGR
jgi:hypothetical protein